MQGGDLHPFSPTEWRGGVTGNSCLDHGGGATVLEFLKHLVRFIPSHRNYWYRITEVFSNQNSIS
jgi:hypothetical protein